MEIGTISLVDVVTFVLALGSLLVASRALSRTKSNELFALRQSLVVKSEQARSEWYRLKRENEAVIKQIQSRFSESLPEVSVLIEGLRGHQEHLENCIRDAVALAEDIHANVDKFSEKKCRQYLRDIDPSLEKLSRNQGLAKGRFEELITRIETGTQRQPQ